MLGNALGIGATFASLEKEAGTFVVNLLGLHEIKSVLWKLDLITFIFFEENSWNSIIHWWFRSVPFYNFRYRLVRVADLFQYNPQIVHCLNIHVIPPNHTYFQYVFNS